MYAKGDLVTQKSLMKMKKLTHTRREYQGIIPLYIMSVTGVKRLCL
jgi:hypothetical protein